MSHQSLLRHTYLFVKQEQLRKKIQIYVQSLKVVFDITLMIYIMLFAGYFIVSFLLSTSSFASVEHLLSPVLDQLSIRYWLVASILPVRYIAKSFRDPGVFFPSSMNHLASLPFPRRNIWLWCFLEKLMKQFCKFALMIGLLCLIFPTLRTIIISYLSLLFIADCLMTAPQWRLFQTRFWVKCCWFIGFLGLYLIGFLLGQQLLALIMFVAVLLVHIKLIPRIARSVHWGRVMEISDFKVWNMPLIGNISKTKFKRKQQYSFLRHTKRRIRPFHYQPSSIYRRLWRIYFLKNMELVGRIVGGLFIAVLLTFILIHNQFMINLVIAGAIYAYASANTILFCNQFQTRTIHVLPWDLTHYKRSYLNWALFGACLFMLPLFVVTIWTDTWWAITEIPFYILTCFTVTDLKLDKACGDLARNTIVNTSEGFRYIPLIGVMFMDHYPAVSFLFIGILVYYVWAWRVDTITQPVS